jgi:dethiobiotin synthetase
MTQPSHAKSVFVAATRQHVGKTSVSLSIVGAMQQLFRGKVGYCKPVGQESIVVRDDITSKRVLVDKDVPLFKEALGCVGEWNEMSPVLMRRGFTKEFLDGRVPVRELHERAVRGVMSIRSKCDFQVIEGTGHTAVGSICGLSNAHIAAMVKSPMILVVNGGIGRAFDDLTLNKALCEQEGATVCGVIVNKVERSKVEQTEVYMRKALARWMIPLVGLVPDKSDLGQACVLDLERKLGFRLLTGAAHRLRHFSRTELVASDVSRFVDDLNANQISAANSSESTLYVFPSSRLDLLLALYANIGENLSKSVVLVVVDPSTRDRYTDEVKRLSSILDQREDSLPVLMCESKNPLDVVRLVEKYTAKLNVEDSERVANVVSHYSQHIDFAVLMDAVLSAYK